MRPTDSSLQWVRVDRQTGWALPGQHSKAARVSLRLEISSAACCSAHLPREPVPEGLGTPGPDVLLRKSQWLRVLAGRQGMEPREDQRDDSAVSRSDSDLRRRPLMGSHLGRLSQDIFFFMCV